MSIISKIIVSLRDDLRVAYASRMRTVWFLIALASLAGMIDIPESSLIQVSRAAIWTAISLIAIFKATFIILLISAARKIKWLRTLLIILAVIYCALCLLQGAIYGLYDMGFTIKLMTVLGQTNRAEILEFFPTLGAGLIRFISNPATYICIAAIALAIIIIRKIPSKLYSPGVTMLSTAGFICFAIAFLSLSAGRTNFSIPLRITKSVISAHREMKQIETELSKIIPLPRAETVKSERIADIVMVVGESASKANHSLYGYSLHTTPQLDNLRERLIVFDNVIGSSTMTSYNMDRILTFVSDDEDPSLWAGKPKLFALMKEAGYHTAWISNQEKSGMWGNSTVAMVSMADDIQFVGSISSDDATLQKHDNVVLPEVYREIASRHPAKFIGVHLLGSHTQYRHRYPHSFGIFTANSVKEIKYCRKLSDAQASVLAEYNNSILYTDYILTEIIDSIARLPRPTLMIYFSDHGENVYDKGEDYCGRDVRHMEVPFIIFPNDAYIKAFPDMITRLKNASIRPMSTASLCHLLCSLTGTSYAAYDSTRDVSSPFYQERQRFVDGKVWKPQ